MTTSISKIPDPQLLMQVQAGDADSFKELFDRYWNLLWRLAAKKTGDTDNAEDMVQDLFIEIWNRKKAIVLTTSLRTYLVSCLYLKIFKYFRQKGFQQKHHDNFLNFIKANDITTPIENKEFEDEYLNLQEIIAQTVALMPTQMKTVFSLKHYKGYTTAEIATQLDISPESVKTHLKHAMSRLRKAGSEYPSSAILLPLFLQMLDSSY